MVMFTSKKGETSSPFYLLFIEHLFFRYRPDDTVAQ